MTLDEEAGRNFLQHVWRLWVEPEIARRTEKGSLPSNVVLDKVQILIVPESRPPIVRLNDEVMGRLVCKLKPGIHKQVIGESVHWKEIEDVLDIELSERDNPDASHITMILFRKGWKIIFDLRNNKRKAKQLYYTACEFLNSARDALARRRMRVLADNLFSAAELFIESQLFVMSVYDYGRRPTHRWTQMKYNEFINIGNYKSDYKNIFNRLSELRDRARYHNKPFSFTKEDAEEAMRIVQDLGEYTRISIT